MRRFTRADGLGNGYAVRMAAEPGGSVWAAVQSPTAFDYDGLSRFDGATWVHFPSAGSPITTVPQSMVADPAAGVWLSDGATAARFDGTAWLTPLSADGAPRGGHLAVDRNGGVWLASYQTIYRLSGSTWEARHSFATAIPNGSAGALAVSEDGTIYVALAEIGTYDSLGVARFDGAAWLVDSLADGLADNSVGALAIDGEGTVWAAHGLGRPVSLSAFDGSRWRALSTADSPGLPGDAAVALAVTPDGALALASVAGGAGIHDSGGWTTLRDTAQPAAYIPFALEEAPDGSLWVGFALSYGAHAIQRRAGGRWETWTLADGIPHLAPLGANLGALAFDSEGQPWLGTWNSGLLTRTDERWRTITMAEGLPSNTVRDVVVAPDDSVWVATPTGVARRDGAVWTVHAMAQGLPSDDVRALAVEAGGAIWAATAAGAARFDGATWTTVTSADGLPDDYVTQVAVGPDGAVWFSTRAGLARRNAGGWRTWTVADGLPGDRFLYGLDVDASGRAWAGLLAANDDSLGLLAVDDAGWRLLTEAEGLLSSGGDGPVFDVLATRDGHVWIASLHGLQEFVPDPLVPWPTPAPATAVPPTPTPLPPVVPSCTCPAARRALPGVVLADALANPAAYDGWGQPVNRNLPPGPSNPPRACLDIQNPGTPYHPTFNGPVWRGGCR